MKIKLANIKVSYNWQSWSSLVSQDDESRLSFRKLISKFVDVDVLVLVAVSDDDFSNGVDFEDESPVVLALVESESLQTIAQA